MKHPLILATLLLAATTAWLGAQALQWEQTTIAIEAPEGEGPVAGVFRFTNTSGQTVRVRSVPASCSCVTARPDPREVAPGAAGEIHFIYSPRGRWGTRAYRIMVPTDEKGRPPYQLRLEVTELRRSGGSD